MKKYLILFILLMCVGLTEAKMTAHDRFNINRDDNTPKAQKYIELVVEGVYEYGSSESFLVRLVEKTGSLKWCLNMVIGSCEADAVLRSLEDIAFSRPLTYDLINSIFTQSSIKLKHVIITKLDDGTFYAVLVLDDNGKEIEIDARPSDSINIALKAGVPIYATHAVWDDAKEELP